MGIFNWKRLELLLLVTAFLLGRAIVFGEFSPFAIAFVATVFFVKRELWVWTGSAALLGALTVQPLFAVVLLGELLLFFGLFQLLHTRWKADLSYAPLAVFLSVLPVLALKLTLLQQWTPINATFILLESGFALVMTLIFAFVLPSFFLPADQRQFMTEQFVGFTIFLAALTIGFADWHVAELSVSQIISRYIILLLALVGGATYGAAVGVMTGLMLSMTVPDTLYQISLLAFAGLLAGLLREGRKLGVSIGLLIGSAILSIYIQDPMLLLHSTWESLIAVVFLLLTPKSWIVQLQSVVPLGHEQSQQKYEFHRRLRQLAATRVEQFSQVFRELAGSFMQFTKEVPTAQAESRKLFHMVSEETCVKCERRANCWSEQPYQTSLYFLDVMHEMQQGTLEPGSELPSKWYSYCVRPAKVLQTMRNMSKIHTFDLQLRHQVRDNRQLVAEQLTGMSQLMDDLANEIKRDGRDRYEEESRVRKALLEIGLSVQQIQIVSLDEGNVHIELVLPEQSSRELSRMMISPLLSSILHESIAVKQERIFSDRTGFTLVSFGTHREFYPETGVAMVAKGGDWLSGDSYTMVELANGGKFAVAVSDGMGNGERAKQESRSALKILEQLLKSGMDEVLAIKSVNSILNLRSTDEVYATVDVALLDLYSADTTFMKIGSMPSYIKRGSAIIPISANNLPVGIVRDIEVDLIRMQLQTDDLLIMVTDGVFAGHAYDSERERWMMKYISEIQVEDAQTFADLLLERVMRNYGGRIDDDMTVLVTRIERQHPSWATFNWNDLRHQEQERVVS